MTLKKINTNPKNSSDWSRKVAINVNQLEKRLFPGQRHVAVDYTAGIEDRYIGVTDTSVARTITLPKGQGANKEYVIKDESGAAGTNNITIQRSGSDTIDGATSVAISTNYGSKRLISNGAGAWFTI